MTRLLVLEASGWKNQPRGATPVFVKDFYHGPAFKALASYLRDAPICGASWLHVMVISADHGTLGYGGDISPQDSEIDHAAAIQIASSRRCRQQMSRSIEACDEMFALGGVSFRGAVAQLLSAKAKTPIFAHGDSSDQVTALKMWLSLGTLTHAERADAICSEIDATHRSYDGPFPPEVIARLQKLEDGLREAVMLAKREG